MKRLKQLKKWIYKQLAKITPGKTAIKGASKALLIGTVVLFILFAIVGVQTMSDPSFIFFIVGFVLMVILASYVLLWTLKKYNQIPRNFKLALLISAPLLIVALANEPLYWIWAVVVLCALGAGIAIIAQGKFKKLSTIKKIITVLGLLTGVLGIAGALIGLTPKGFEMDPIINAASLNAKDISSIVAESPATKGDYKVNTLTYGSGKDKHRPEFAEDVIIKTDSVNGVPFLDNWEGFSGWYREKYWGFDAKALPVNGYVWYPEGEGPFPLALIVHGNHSMQDFSDTGYGYLGELMASRGIIFASVDENFFNSSWSDIFGGLDEENDARGWMLLEHLKVWNQWNEDPSNEFYNKIDTTKLALIGHSRGGEAVAHAALLNKMPYYFDDATIPFDYNYDIQSIVAIAPVDGQYEPGNARTELTDINYFVLHGAQDGDVSSFSGSKQYERITFSDSTDYFKSGLYIQGANHGQFNTSWGANDVSFSGTKFLNNAQLLPKEQQEEIAKVYISAFLETTLNDKEEYKPLFLDARKGKDWLPETIYLNQYEDSSFQPIATYDDDFDVITTNDTIATISSEKLSVWREQEIDLKWGQKGSRAAYIGWHYDNIEDGEPILDSIVASYSIEFKNAFAKADSTSTLVFSLAESTEKTDPKSGGKWVNNNKENSTEDENFEDETEEGEEGPKDAEDNDEEDELEQPIDFTIVLQDDTGQKIEFPLSDFSALQREINVRIWKVQFITSESQSEKVFQTFTYPLSKIQEKYPDFGISSINKIQFVFNKTPQGVIVLDNLGFTKSF